MFKSITNLWERFGYYFSIAVSWLKSMVQKLKKNRKLCKRIILVLLFVLTWQVGVRYGATHVEIPEPEIIYVTLEPEIVSRSVEIHSEQESNINDIAKVLYGYRYNSDRDLEGIAWIILNRVDNQAEFKNFNTISSVVNQPSQWMGYGSDNPVLENLYDIAEKVLSEYNSDGKHLFAKDFLYFTWSQDYIVFRTEFKDSPTCKYWRSY